MCEKCTFRIGCTTEHTLLVMDCEKCTFRIVGCTTEQTLLDLGNLFGLCIHKNYRSRWVFETCFDDDRIARLKENLVLGKTRLKDNLTSVWTDGLLWDIPLKNSVSKALAADTSETNPAWNTVLQNYVAHIDHYLQTLKKLARYVPIVWFTTHYVPSPVCNTSPHRLCRAGVRPCNCRTDAEGVGSGSTSSGCACLPCPARSRWNSFFRILEV